MNNLQKSEFDILKHFVRICNELSLTYFLVCGSALGAVKYKGFIPWDDDIDVALPRKDYEVFLREAPKRLPEHLFLQNYRTDPLFPKVFSKIRDCRSTYIEKDYKNLDINHGVFIDVFALDGYPDTDSDIKKFERNKKRFIRLTSCSLLPNGSLKSKVLRQILRIFGYHKRTHIFLKKYDEMICKYVNAQVFCNYGNFRGVIEITPKSVYGEGTEALFEGLSVRIPAQYDRYLKEKYGNYHDDPPIDEQVAHHYYAVMDLETPFTAYK